MEVNLKGIHRCLMTQRFCCFNPNFNGSKSESFPSHSRAKMNNRVSILILMEVSPKEKRAVDFWKQRHGVSILILMEVSLKESYVTNKHERQKGFNPNFNGSKSESVYLT